MKILVSDPLSEKGLEILRTEKEFQVDVKTGLSPEELKKIIGEYDALLIRSGTKVTAEIIEKADKLRVIGRAGVGIDNVDVEAASKRGIIVMNTPGGNTISTAEHTMSLILAIARSIPRANATLKEGEWARKKFVGVEIYGKMLGVIGMGRIGAEVAKRAQSFQMKVMAFDPFLSVDKAQKLDVELVSLDDLYRRSDFITLHVPLSNETRGMIGREALSKMKDGVYIVNCARGGLVDEEDLVKAIQSGKVAGAAFDVFEKEPPGKSPLIEMDRVVATPHLGASTQEAQINVAIDVAKQVMEALRGGRIINSVNAPSLDDEQMKQLRPYLFLSEKLGRLLAQILEGNLESLEISYRGEIGETETTPITLSFLKGLLGYALPEEVNFINAPVIAKERGIRVIESKSAAEEEFADAICVEASCGKKKFCVEGAVFGAKKEARIVRINGYHVDAVPKENLLVISNEDKPGVIGNVSTLLGENDVNIAGMTVGRNVPGGKALTVIEVDGTLSKDLLKQISSIRNVLNARIVNF